MWIARQLTHTITTNLSYLSSWLLLNIFLAMLFLETSEEKKRIGYESLLSQYENFLVILTRFRSKNSSQILVWFYRETLLIAYN